MLLTKSDCVFVGFILHMSGIEAKIKCALRGSSVDLQVKVIPFQKEQTVSLMCSTSGSLTEHPVVYIWYRNEEVLYEDWSPWYQQLVSSDKAVTYSCAIKGYEHLKAPEVSVDSVNSTCFTVTFLRGMTGKSRTITYPREVHVGTITRENHVSLTCDSSCSQTDCQTEWYKNRRSEGKIQANIPLTSMDVFSCALKDHGDLLSDEVCMNFTNCWKLNYNSRRFCKLEDSSVNITCSYSKPFEQLEADVWLKKNISTQQEAEELKETNCVEYHSNRSRSTLTIKQLKQNDSGEYFYIANAEDRKSQLGYPGVTLIVTGLRVEFAPSADVTEGQRVTVTCTTSCPLTDDTNYLWYLNNQKLNLTEKNKKHLVLDPVRRQDAGNYFCEVRSLSSNSRELTVKTKPWTTAATGVLVTLVIILALILAAAFFLIRRKVTSNQRPENFYEDVNQLDLDHKYDTITAEQDEELYMRVDDTNYRLVYTTVQPHPPQEQSQMHSYYSAVRVNPREDAE